jgi:hypothetical protein
MFARRPLQVSELAQGGEVFKQFLKTNFSEERAADIMHQVQG